MVVEEFDGGLVIYDGREARAHWLDASATAVWRACREPRTEAQIALAAGLERPSCEIVLSQLIALGLVVAESDAGYSRRVVLRSAARFGLGAAVAAPIISTVIPAAAAAASGPPPPSPPQPPSPGPGPQTIGADRTFVPGPPNVSGVTVEVVGGNGTGAGRPKHPLKGFSLRRVTVDRHGVIVLTLSARTSGTFAANAWFDSIERQGQEQRSRRHGHYGSGSGIPDKRGSLNLRIVPTKAAARALAAHRRLNVSITITFTPARGAPRTIRASLTI